MFFFMAEDTRQSRVFCVRRRQAAGDVRMTGRALAVRHIRSDRNRKGLVGRMADHAVLVRLLGRMRLVALHARGNIPVCFMTGGTEQLRMERRGVLQLLSLLWMAGKARGREINCQLHVERRVRVGMACVASADLVVRFPGVTLAAERNNLILAHHRGMSFMATHAGNGGLMLAPLALHRACHRGMTFAAVAVCELCLVREAFLHDEMVR